MAHPSIACANADVRQGGGNVRSIVSSFLNSSYPYYAFRIEQDESVNTPDRRRITRLVESVEDKSVPIHLPHPRAAHPPAMDKGAPEKKSLGDLD